MKSRSYSHLAFLVCCVLGCGIAGCRSATYSQATAIVEQVDDLLREAVLNDLFWSRLTVVGLTDEERDQPFYQTNDMLGSLHTRIEGGSLVFRVVADPTREGIVLAKCSSLQHPEIFYSFFRPPGTMEIRIDSTTSPDPQLFENAVSVAVPVSRSWFCDYLALAGTDTRSELLRKAVLEYAERVDYRGHFFIAPTTPRATQARVFWFETGSFLRVVIPSHPADLEHITELVRESGRPAFENLKPIDEKHRLWNETLVLQYYRDAWICSTFGTCVRR